MRFAFLLMLAISAASYAEDPFSCVDSDVTEAFLGNSYLERAAYSTSIPDGFLPLNVPGGLSLVGSKLSDSTTTVVYRATMEAESAFDAAVEAMARSGWAENRGQGLGMMGGFQTIPRPVAAVLCHDDEPGALVVSANDRTGRTFVSYEHHSDSSNCVDAPATVLDEDPFKMMRLLPRLKVPKGVEATNGGSGGYSGGVASNIDISGGTGRSELKNFCEDQLRNQSWEFQTGWSSDLSSGSVWTFNLKDDGLLIGTLHLFDSGSEPIRVRFDASPADPKRGMETGTWSSSLQ